MNDDLVQRLRSNRPLPTLPHEAADRIEALEAEIERLRERVKRVENNNRELRGSKERVYAATDLRQPTQSDALKAAGDAIRGLLDITSDYNLDSEQAGRAYAALHDIGTALKGQSK